MNLDPIIRSIQRKLGVGVDGQAGPQTWQAIYEFVFPERRRLPAGSHAPVDPRSERNIATLHSEIAPYARALVHAAAAQGITIKIISALRTFEEQEALFAQGRTTPGPIVTNARGGFSNHNFGIAFDVGVFEGNRYLPESTKYKVVGSLGMQMGLEWGGNWTTIVDEPHFQLRPLWAEEMSESQMLAELRDRKREGEDAFA
jgi:peptidoglycan L-alanyl-D-glutamate endopeptidase CwlK